MRGRTSLLRLMRRDAVARNTAGRASGRATCDALSTSSSGVVVVAVARARGAARARRRAVRRRKVRVVRATTHWPITSSRSFSSPSSHVNRHPHRRACAPRRPEQRRERARAQRNFREVARERERERERESARASTCCTQNPHESAESPATKRRRRCVDTRHRSRAMCSSRSSLTPTRQSRACTRGCSRGARTVSSPARPPNRADNFGSSVTWRVRRRPRARPPAAARRRGALLRALRRFSVDWAARRPRQDRATRACAHRPGHPLHWRARVLVPPTWASTTTRARLLVRGEAAAAVATGPASTPPGVDECLRVDDRQNRAAACPDSGELR